MKHKSTKMITSNIPFWALITFLIITFMLGGSARGDVESLILLRPVAVFFLCVGLWNLKWAHIRAYQFLFAMAAAIILLVVLHLIPLPPALWRSLAGHQIVMQVDQAAQLGAVWRPLTLVPLGTWNALFSLTVPLTALILAVQIGREQRFQLLLVLLTIIAASGLIGFLQILGASDGPLYLYNITNNGAAVGLFANRNHQAALLVCLFPMLAVFASTGMKSIEQARVRGWAAVASGLVLVPLLLITGSRAGLLIGIVGLASAALLYKQPQFTAPAKRVVKRFDPRMIYGAFAVSFIALLSLLAARAEAIQRLLETDELNGGRLPMWAVGWQMLIKYFPTGSGFGSIVEAFDIDEPQAMLGPAYTNHLHNDWLEVVVSGGLPVIILICLAIVVWAKISLPLWLHRNDRSRDKMFARLGSVIVLMLALASIPDYPLRVPSLSCVFVLAAVWLSNPSDKVSNKSVGVAFRDGNP